MTEVKRVEINGFAEDARYGLPKYVVVITHYERGRACWQYTLRPTTSLWWAKFKLRFHLLFVEDDCDYVICSLEQSRHLLTSFRNWLGENRIY